MTTYSSAKDSLKKQAENRIRKKIIDFAKNVQIHDPTTDKEWAQLKLDKPAYHLEMDIDINGFAVSVEAVCQGHMCTWKLEDTSPYNDLLTKLLRIHYGEYIHRTIMAQYYEDMMCVGEVLHRTHQLGWPEY